MGMGMGTTMDADMKMDMLTHIMDLHLDMDALGPACYRI